MGGLRDSGRYLGGASDALAALGSPVAPERYLGPQTQVPRNRFSPQLPVISNAIFQRLKNKRLFSGWDLVRGTCNNTMVIMMSHVDSKCIVRVHEAT